MAGGKLKLYKPKAKSAKDKQQDKKIEQLARAMRFSKESKFIDQQYQTSIGTTWANVLTRPLTYIAQGTGVGQRVGDKISIKRIQLKVTVTAGDGLNTYRILMVRFGHCPTANLGIQNVLENYNNITPFQIMSFFKRNAPSKYEILWDSGVQSVVGNASSSSLPYTSRTIKNYNVVRKYKKGKLVQYSGNGPSTETNGFIYVVAVSDSAVIPHVGFQTMARVIYQG